MPSFIAADVSRLTQDMVELRRDLHRHPELAFQEQRTAQIIAQRLGTLGIEVATGVGGTGVVGLLPGAHPGPTLMVRADIDALPITEKEGRPYGSESPGKMHACGHDGHTAVVAAVATVLASRRNAMKGNVKFVFQPAEETMSGAVRMIQDGVMDSPKPDRVLGFHF